jgi:hypothetical protein
MTSILGLEVGESVSSGDAARAIPCPNALPKGVALRQSQLERTSRVTASGVGVPFEMIRLRATSGVKTTVTKWSAT